MEPKYPIKMKQYKKMGEMLLERGVISQTDLQDVLEVQRQFPRRFGDILKVIGLVSELDIIECLSAQYQLPILKFEQLLSEPEAMLSLPVDYLRDSQILPLKVTSKTFTCVVSDPLSIIEQEIRLYIGERTIKVYLAQPSHLAVAIDQVCARRQPRRRRQKIAA